MQEEQLNLSQRVGSGTLYLCLTPSFLLGSAGSQTARTEHSQSPKKNPHAHSVAQTLSKLPDTSEIAIPGYYGCLSSEPSAAGTGVYWDPAAGIG